MGALWGSRCGGRESLRSELRCTGEPRRRRRDGGLSPSAEALSAVELSSSGGLRARRGGGVHCGVLHSSGRSAGRSGPCRRLRERGGGDGHGEDGEDGDPRGSARRPRGSFPWLHFFFPAGSRFSFPRPRLSCPRLRVSGFRFSFPAGSRFFFPASSRFSFLRVRSRLDQAGRLPRACERPLPGGEKSGSSDGVEAAVEEERALEAAEVELKRRLRSSGGEIHFSGGGSRQW